ncbi:hypothetical protein GJ496_007265 [Pomphorhynchus laevis]|nr:hypothetical protein GJ496_007265 [Pomphorhynchus laevis]
MHANDNSNNTGASGAGKEIQLPVVDSANNSFPSNITDGNDLRRLPGKKRKSKAMTHECTICGIICNSEVVYEEHIVGQKHLKKLNALTDSLNKSATNNSNVPASEVVSISDPKAVLQRLHMLANFNKLFIVFSTTGEPLSADSNSAKSTTNCYEVKLTVGENFFTSKGSSIEEAQHLAALMALEKIDFKRIPLNTDVQATSSNTDVVSPVTERSTKNSYLMDGYPSAMISERSFSLSRIVSVDSDVNVFIKKHLMPSTKLRNNLHNLADYAIRTLMQTANSLATHYSALDKKWVIDKDPAEIPPSVLHPIRLTRLALTEYARLFWAIRIGYFTSGLLSDHDRTVRIIVLCSKIESNSNCSSDDQDILFLNEVRSKMPEAEIADQMLVIKRTHKDQNKQIKLAAEIVFVDINSTTVTPCELKRQLWFNQHLANNKTAIGALRILRELSRINKDGLNLVSQYTWEVLVNLVSDIETYKQCPSVICVAVLSKIAGGMFLNGGSGLSDPCSDESLNWSLSEPYCAGCLGMSSEQRVAITKSAQKILNETIHPFIKTGTDFLRRLLEIKESP